MKLRTRLKRSKWKYFIFIIVLIVIITYVLYFYNIVEHKSYSDSDFNIVTYKSSVDKDNDGIDDQSDILNSVKEYIKTNPQYKSKYYETGYPSDEYGVCTDIVAVGLLNSGYNLMELVNSDIELNKDLYNIDVIDKNIDFRRVKNLYVYFENNAIKLTNDIYDIEKWQGGDIVVFEKHVAIVSDKRNKNGVPFIIHHYSEYQYRYEEDILENRTDIIGHYRIS